MHYPYAEGLVAYLEFWDILYAERPNFCMRKVQ
jgi:hypothetical protein